MNSLYNILGKYICCATDMAFPGLRFKRQLTNPHKVPLTKITISFIVQRWHRVLNFTSKMLGI